MSSQMTVNAKAACSGPLFDGQAEAAIGDWIKDTQKAIADEGVTALRAFPMDKTGRARGNFQRNLNVITRGPDQVIPAPTITGVTWGPWLEGESQRNTSSRFKGYHLFRLTAQDLQQRAPGIAEAELDKYIGRMGGTP